MTRDQLLETLPSGSFSVNTEAARAAANVLIDHWASCEGGTGEPIDQTPGVPIYAYDVNDVCAELMEWIDRIKTEAPAFIMTNGSEVILG